MAWHMKTTKHPVLKAMSTLIIALLAARSARCAVFTWSGTAPGDWSNPVNWNPNGVPGTNDSAVIANGVVSVTTMVPVSGISLVGNGSLNLAGGAIVNAVISTTNGASVVVNTGTLDGVVVNGLLDVGMSVNGAGLTVTNGLTLNGTAYVGNPTNTWYGVINFEGTQTLSGSGTPVFGNHSYANSLLLANAGATLLIAAGITVHGQNGSVGYNPSIGGGSAGANVVNQGMILEDLNKGTITIAGGSLINNGTLEAQNGGVLQLNSGTWTNNGTIQADAGTVNLGGSFATAGLGVIQSPGGMINLTGTLNNTNSTLVVDGAMAPWTLVGGTISGGTVATTNGAALVASSGTLDGVTMNGSLDVGNSMNGASLTVTNGLVLNGIALVGNRTNSWVRSGEFHGQPGAGGQRDGGVWESFLRQLFVGGESRGNFSDWRGHHGAWAERLDRL